jgi:hypothetical protein
MIVPDPLMTTHRNQMAFMLIVGRLESKGVGGRFPAFGPTCLRKRGALEFISSQPGK